MPTTATAAHKHYTSIRIERSRGTVVTTNLPSQLQKIADRPSKALLHSMGINMKRYNQLMTGQSEWLLSEYVAACAFFNLPLEQFVTFIPAKN